MTINLLRILNNKIGCAIVLLSWSINSRNQCYESSKSQIDIYIGYLNLEPAEIHFNCLSTKIDKLDISARYSDGEGRRGGIIVCYATVPYMVPRFTTVPAPVPIPIAPIIYFIGTGPPLSPPPLCHPWYRVVHWTNYSLILVSCSLNAFLCLHLSVEKKGLDRLLISNTPNLYGDLINSNTFYQPPDTKIKCLWVNAWVSKHSYKTTSTCLLSQVVSESVGIH